MTPAMVSFTAPAGSTCQLLLLLLLLLLTNMSISYCLHSLYQCEADGNNVGPPALGVRTGDNANSLYEMTGLDHPCPCLRLIANDGVGLGSKIVSTILCMKNRRLDKTEYRCHLADSE
ncbi:uncharacterized protein GGS22DRAFT_100641 [Annulohypoxylon maeteangense]|uniref:uncharacterized protein n=1 Tax=Annulohypoxylon maeteangense TaxID=1927788 RepID=UPI002008E93F|nr:uncharacterized protein GGS22DRAFT_100641 [Annulohypoxylon maeteangense]KAI0880068.1 hypothetical protein GGS22DRAFT_100641 [Annulohypoxylon maeteangense]